MDKVKAAIVGCGRISDLHEMGYRQRDLTGRLVLAERNSTRDVAERPLRERDQGLGRRKARRSHRQESVTPMLQIRICGADLRGLEN